MIELKNQNKINNFCTWKPKETHLMIIKARNLSKKVIFNGEEINILDKIDLDISSNTSLAVVGPSGSGKSTLWVFLRDWILLQGEIFFDDMPLHSMSEDSRSKIRKNP